MLIKGEPGTGKTMLAEEVAAALGLPLFSGTSSPRPRRSRDSTGTTPSPACVTRSSATRRLRDIAHYIVKGVLWQAFDCETPCVVLIDEIDKADIEFPNDLLRELDRMEFTSMRRGRWCAPGTGRSSSSPRTTKGAAGRLPRRCFFHYIKFPTARRWARSSTSIPRT